MFVSIIAVSYYSFRGDVLSSEELIKINIVLKSKLIYGVGSDDGSSYRYFTFSSGVNNSKYIVESCSFENINF